MAGDPRQERHAHLMLVREQQSIERKKTGGGKSTPVDAPARKKSAAKLKTKLDEFKLEVEKAKPVAPGVNPHLVFKVPVTEGANTKALAELFEAVDLHVVSYEADGAIIVFRDDADLTELMKRVEEFEEGPRRNARTGDVNKTMGEDVLHQIDFNGMRRWGRQDRIGQRLADLLKEVAEGKGTEAILPVDVELWHGGSTALARKAIEEIKTSIPTGKGTEERISDEYIGETTILIRVKARLKTVDALADLDVVAELDLPPVPVFDRFRAHRLRKSDFKLTTSLPSDAPSVCVVDSGVTSGHPLLKPHVGAETTILTKGESAADSNGHGTMVGGFAVFGDVRACYDSGEFSSPVRLYSARVLNEHNVFDDDELVVTQMRKAIEAYMGPPHHCRVFNLSLGTSSATLMETGGRQKPWAEALDVLARRHRVLIVVSAGNRTELFEQRGSDAEKVLKNYPSYLMDRENGLNEPATASIAVTVGALAQYDAPAINNFDETVRAVAGSNEPAPYSRCGPGMRGAIKPEFVDYGGNAAFAGLLQSRKITDKDPGLAAMSFSREPMKTLFNFSCGTSFAAPRVANKATRLWKELEAQLRTPVHPNLVRAVMAVGAARPEAAVMRIDPEGEDLDRQLRVLGYGMIDLDEAVASTDMRVTMVDQGEVTLDHFVVYGVPLPEEYLKAPGEKVIDVAIAYDPPVRSRRMDYLGVQMTFDLYRENDLARVIEACRKPDNEQEEGVSSGASMSELKKVPLVPGHTFKSPKLSQRDVSTLQKASWRVERPRPEIYGDSLWLVVRALNRWNPVPDDKQHYAVAVTMRADEPRLRELLRARLQQHVRARQRS